MLDTLITSRTRIKLLLKFFSNSSNEAYLRSLAQEFGESTNSVRVELNRLSVAGLLESEPAGKTILYRANTQHSLFPELKAIVGKYLGFDRIVEGVVTRLGEVQVAFVTGGYAKGQDNGVIDLVLVGAIDKAQLLNYIDKTEKLIHRELRVLTLTVEEFQKQREELLNPSPIVLWGQIPE